MIDETFHMTASDIFFSYAREDQARVALVVAALEARGWSVFWDRRIPAGKTWRTHIGQALEQARCVVVAWSKHSIKSDWVIEEADDGRERNILVPLFLEPVRPPPGFRAIQTTDLSSWSPERPSPEFNSLLADLAAMLGSAPVKQPDRPKGVAPARPQWYEPAVHGILFASKSLSITFFLSLLWYFIWIHIIVGALFEAEPVTNLEYYTIFFGPSVLFHYCASVYFFRSLRLNSVDIRSMIYFASASAAALSLFLYIWLLTYFRVLPDHVIPLGIVWIALQSFSPIIGYIVSCALRFRST